MRKYKYLSYSIRPPAILPQVRFLKPEVYLLTPQRLSRRRFLMDLSGTSQGEPVLSVAEGTPEDFRKDAHRIRVHPETTKCHSERSEESLLTPLTMRFFVALLLRMTSENRASGWTRIRARCASVFAKASTRQAAQFRKRVPSFAVAVDHSLNIWVKRAGRTKRNGKCKRTGSSVGSY
jgi:hypothetical protein